MAESSEQNIPKLLANALRDAQDLIAKQVELLRAEVGDGLRTLMLALILVILASVLLVTGLMVLILALVKWLALMVGSEALAALIVGGALMLVASVLALVGRNKMKLQSLAPNRTVQALRQDAAIVEERLRL